MDFSLSVVAEQPVIVTNKPRRRCSFGGRNVGVRSLPLASHPTDSVDELI